MPKVDLPSSTKKESTRSPMRTTPYTLLHTYTPIISIQERGFQQAPFARLGASPRRVVKRQPTTAVAVFHLPFSEAGHWQHACLLSHVRIRVCLVSFFSLVLMTCHPFTCSCIDVIGVVLLRGEWRVSHALIMIMHLCWAFLDVRLGFLIC